MGVQSGIVRPSFSIPARDLPAFLLGQRLGVPTPYIILSTAEGGSGHAALQGFSHCLEKIYKYQYRLYRKPSPPTASRNK